MEKRELFTIVKSEAEQIQIIIKNVLLMISNRIYIDEDGNKKPMLTNDKYTQVSENIFEFETDNKKKYVTLITFQKLTAVGKSSVVNDFFNDYPTHRKIIVATE